MATQPLALTCNHFGEMYHFAHPGQFSPGLGGYYYCSEAISAEYVNLASTTVTVNKTINRGYRKFWFIGMVGSFYCYWYWLEGQSWGSVRLPSHELPPLPSFALVPTGFEFGPHVYTGGPFSEYSGLFSDEVFAWYYDGSPEETNQFVPQLIPDTVGSYIPAFRFLRLTVAMTQLDPAPWVGATCSVLITGSGFTGPGSGTNNSGWADALIDEFSSSGRALEAILVGPGTDQPVMWDVPQDQSGLPFFDALGPDGRQQRHAALTDFSNGGSLTSMVLRYNPQATFGPATFAGWDQTVNWASLPPPPPVPVQIPMAGRFRSKNTSFSRAS